VYVLGDGPELLVYSAVNDAPLWKKFCDGRLAGVGATRDRVFAVDTGGRLTRWRAIDGATIDELDTGIGGTGPRAVCGLAVSLDGNFAVWSPEGLRVGVDAMRISASEARSVAFSADGRTLAVGTEAGAIEWYSTANGEPIGKTELPSVSAAPPVMGLCWKPGNAPGVGQWLATAGSRLFVCDTPVPPPPPSPKAGPPGSSLPPVPVAQAPLVVELGGTAGFVACMADGALAAVQVGSDVVLYELWNRQACGAVRLQRPLVGLAFGPGTWLGIGFENGDANRLDVVTGHLTKCEAHAGRTANRWAVKVECDPLKVRQAIAFYRAGGDPIARTIAKGEGKKKGRGCLFWVGITFLVLFLCAGCSGMLSLAYYQFYLPH